MQKLLVFVLFMCYAMSANALQFQIKLERDSDTWVELDPSIITYEEVDGVRKVYPEAPDPNSTSYTNLQEWYVLTDGGYNLMRFKATDTIIELPKGRDSSDYLLRVSLDGELWSLPADRSVRKPTGPVPSG